MNRKKIGVILSGCGVKDGSEIHEATLTLYFLDKLNAEIICMAPDKDQFDVVRACFPAGKVKRAIPVRSVAVSSAFTPQRDNCTS